MALKVLPFVALGFRIDGRYQGKYRWRVSATADLEPTCATTFPSPKKSSSFQMG